MAKQFIRASLMLIVLTLLTGIAYPLVVTGLAQLTMPRQANGSLVYREGRMVGSSLLGQKFSSPRYFHGRPSAAGAGGYDAAASGGTNLGPTNRQLVKSVTDRASQVRTENGLSSKAIVPSDLATASASGLDPHISPAAAEIQVARVAKERHLASAKVRELVRRYTEEPQFGLLGEPRVNVLRLNLALDGLETAGR